MKVVIAHRSREARVVDLATPSSHESFITVRVSHSALILPDELMALSQAGRMAQKGDDGFPLGSCASGTVIETGAKVKTLKKGVRVAVCGNPYVYHGAQLVVPEALAIELPKKVNHEEGSYAGLGARALNLLRTAPVQIGEVILIIGADLLGLLTAQLVKAAGAIPVLVDDSEFRLNKARTIGIPRTFLPTDEDLLRTVSNLTHGYGVDTALITRAGDRAGYTLACDFLCHGGVLILGADLEQRAPIDLLREKAIQIRPAIGGGAGAANRDHAARSSLLPRTITRWTERDNMGCFCDLLAERKVQITPLITDRIPVDRAQVVYEKASRGRDSVLGAVFTY